MQTPSPNIRTFATHFKSLNRNTVHNYNCSLSTANIEYSCPSVCLSACLCVCLSVYTIPETNNSSIHLKLEHIVVYENSLDEFDIGH